MVADSVVGEWRDAIGGGNLTLLHAVLEANKIKPCELDSQIQLDVLAY